MTDIVLQLALAVIPAILAITLHEAAHGYAALALGDDTARLAGRLSLNPLRHVDRVGTILLPGFLLVFQLLTIHQVLFMFGWAKPVPVATSALRNPRRALVWVAFAGPAANILMAVVWSALLALIARTHGNRALIDWLALMAQAGIWVNGMLAVFNLLPIPPLDGGKILTGLLPPQWGERLRRIEPFGVFLVLGLSLLRGFDWLFVPAFRGMTRLIIWLGGAA